MNSTKSLLASSKFGISESKKENSQTSFWIISMCVLHTFTKRYMVTQSKQMSQSIKIGKFCIKKYELSSGLELRLLSKPK